MHRLHFLIPSARKADRYEPMYLAINPLTMRSNINNVRRIYRILRRAGWSSPRARWAVYDVMAIRCERAGSGYDL
jgi:hypothetical protein